LLLGVLLGLGQIAERPAQVALVIGRGVVSVLAINAYMACFDATSPNRIA
jgi:hypothetical protein